MLSRDWLTVGLSQKNSINSARNTVVFDNGAHISNRAMPVMNGHDFLALNLGSSFSSGGNFTSGDESHVLHSTQRAIHQVKNHPCPYIILASISVMDKSTACLFFISKSNKCAPCGDFTVVNWILSIQLWDNYPQIYSFNKFVIVWDWENVTRGWRKENLEYDFTLWKYAAEGVLILSIK